MIISWLDHPSKKARFLVSISSLSVILIAAIFGFSLFHTKTSDVLPKLSRITKQDLATIDPNTAQVETGIYIRYLDAFSILKNNIVINSFVWFYFDPNKISLEKIEKFSFVNGTITSKELSKKREINGKILAEYQVKVEFRNELTFKYFPYDSHYLSIILTNDFVTPQEMIYISQDQNFKMSPLIYLSNWNIKQLEAHYGYFTSKINGDKQKIVSPEVLFIMHAINTGKKNSIILLVPLLFALLLALFSLLIPYQNSTTRFIISLSSGATTTLLAYRFVIQTMIPDVGYATLTDLVYTLCLLVSFVIFVTEIIFIIFLQQKTLISTESEIKKIANTLTHYSIYLFFILDTIAIIGLYKILII